MSGDQGSGRRLPSSSSMTALSTTSSAAANGKGLSELTPVEEPEKNQAEERESPKRQSSTVLERVKAKLSRSLSLSSSTPGNLYLRDKENSSGVERRRDRRPAGVVASGPTTAVAAAAPPRGERYQSELHGPNTAELLARFVAERAVTNGSDQPVAAISGSESGAGSPFPPPRKVEGSATASAVAAIHSPLPRTSATRPIISVDKSTGIIAVNQVR